MIGTRRRVKRKRPIILRSGKKQCQNFNQLKGGEEEKREEFAKIDIQTPKLTPGLGAIGLPITENPDFDYISGECTPLNGDI